MYNFDFVFYFIFGIKFKISLSRFLFLLWPSYSTLKKVKLKIIKKPIIIIMPINKDENKPII